MTLVWITVVSGVIARLVVFRIDNVALPRSARSCALDRKNPYNRRGELDETGSR